MTLSFLGPIVAPFLRRQPEMASPQPEAAPEPQSWPGSPATYDDDLLISQANEAELARQLVAVRKRLDKDEQVEQLRQAERRAEAAEAEHLRVAAELRDAHQKLRDLTAANASLRRQLHREFGYDEAAIDAIENGTGEPAGKRALT